MKAWRAWGFAAAVGVLVTAPPAGAHHAIIAEYEMSVTKAFTGVMTRFAVINPHVRWFFVETKPDGTKVEWEMSGAGPGALRAAGLMRIFKVGEQYRGDVRAREERRKRWPGPYDEGARWESDHAVPRGSDQPTQPVIRRA